MNNKMNLHANVQDYFETTTESRVTKRKVVLTRIISPANYLDTFSDVLSCPL